MLRSLVGSEMCIRDRNPGDSETDLMIPGAHLPASAAFRVPLYNVAYKLATEARDRLASACFSLAELCKSFPKCMMLIPLMCLVLWLQSWPCQLSPSELAELRQMAGDAHELLHREHVPFMLCDQTLVAAVRDGCYDPEMAEVHLCLKGHPEWGKIDGILEVEGLVPLENTTVIRSYVQKRDFGWVHPGPGYLRGGLAVLQRARHSLFQPLSVVLHANEMLQADGETSIDLEGVGFVVPKHVFRTLDMKFGDWREHHPRRAGVVCGVLKWVPMTVGLSYVCARWNYYHWKLQQGIRLNGQSGVLGGCLLAMALYTLVKCWLLGAESVSYTHLTLPTKRIV
eukprot:TRINITY_DN7005_c0_g1_i3.p1 TRINITY_DN7005_c0_g1~~TRINITY_DN7005_c0_g1_i3.p1  ORF type:complete len:392 (+),score=77.77 TRINITY_DN7005_c0_g1_i3:157-1176(+)